MLKFINSLFNLVWMALLCIFVSFPLQMGLVKILLRSVDYWGCFFVLWSLALLLSVNLSNKEKT